MPTTDPTYIVQSGQTLLDICMQSAGEIDGLFLSAVSNGMGITDDLVTGQSAFGLSAATAKAGIAALFNNLPPASGITVEQALPGGIGYMQIQQTFIVS